MRRMRLFSLDGERKAGPSVPVQGRAVL